MSYSLSSIVKLKRMCNQYLSVIFILASISITFSFANHDRYQHEKFLSASKTYGTTANRFSLLFLKNYPPVHTGNKVFSPMSLLCNLDLAYMGTSSQSRSKEELKELLGYDQFEDDEEAHKGLKNTIDQVNSLHEYEGLEFTSENLIMNNKKEFSIYPSYKEKVAEYHRVKFEDFYTTAGLDTKINKWVERKTRGAIKDAVSNDDLLESVLIFMNVAYFKANWLTTFNPENTVKSYFYNNGKSRKKVDMMRSDQPVHYLDCKSKDDLQLPAEAISLEFSMNNGTEIDMVFILPDNKEGLPKLIRQLSDRKLKKIYKYLMQAKSSVKVMIPKFDFLADTPAKDILKYMGLKTYLVHPDLSNMGQTTSPMKVDKIIHKARVKINEDGAEASAATETTMKLRSLKPMFTANHPFLFIIRHTRTNFPLFVGEVNEFKSDFF